MAELNPHKKIEAAQSELPLFNIIIL